MTMNGFQRQWIKILMIVILVAAGSAGAAAEDGSDGGAAVLRMLNGVTFSADFRVRYEGIFDDTAIANNRGRLRIRAGFQKTFGDFASITFRGASGSEAEPTSTNQTLTGNFTPKSFNIDRAYGTLRPTPNVELSGGKMPVPFFATDLMWDDDLNPEGLAQTFRIPGDRGGIEFHFGEFIFNNSAAAEDGYLFGSQAVLTIGGPPRWRWTLAPAYTQVLRPNSTLTVGLNGNLTNAAGTALVSEFRIVNVPLRLERTLKSGRPFWIDLDIAHNRGAKAFAGKTYETGYLAEISIGRSKKRGDWLAKYRYGRIEPDAVLSAFNDSDFSFTDSKGHRVKFEYLPWDSFKLTATGYFLQSVRPNVRPDRTRIQIDAMLSF